MGYLFIGKMYVNIKFYNWINFMQKILEWYICLHCSFKFYWESNFRAEQCPKCRSEELKYKGKVIIYENSRERKEE